MNYHADPMAVGKIYSKFGRSYVKTILQPKIKEAIVGITPQYIPEEMLQKREEIRSRMENSLKAKLDSADSHLIVDGFTITEFQFSRAFNEAIEAKQVAEQNLIKTKTEQEQVIVVANAEAEATLTRAQAQADANKLLSESITPEVIEYQKVQKWDGKLPTVTGTGSFMDVSGLTGDAAD